MRSEGKKKENDRRAKAVLGAKKEGDAQLAVLLKVCKGAGESSRCGSIHRVAPLHGEEGQGAERSISAGTHEDLDL